MAAFIFPKGAAADPALRKPHAPPRSSAAGTGEKRRLIVAGVIGTVALVAVAAGLAAGLVARGKGAPAPSAAGPNALLDADYCSRLPEAAQAYCMAYYTSAGRGRFTAASQWNKKSSITCERLVAHRPPRARLRAWRKPGLAYSRPRRRLLNRQIPQHLQTCALA